MNRKVLFIVSLFAFITFNLTTIAQSKKTSDAERERMKGNVMSVKEDYFYKPKQYFGFIIDKHKTTSLTNFNKDGNYTYEEQPCLCSGDYLDKSYFTYNTQGFCVEVIEYLYENQDEFPTLWRYTYKYDHYENMIEEEWFSNGVFFCEYHNKYDTNGYLIETIIFQPGNDSSPIKEIIKRNSYGNITEKTIFNKLDVFSSNFLYENDKKGNMIKEEHYGLENKLLYRILFKSNKQGDVIEEKNFKYQEDTISHDFSYYKYKYDSYGNWKKRTIYKEDGSIESITKRKIKYYHE
ncbi:MAG: hypothetical protein PHG98_06940 [Bacteroidales bacterium]|nr:hypothetical protein [Bacteroidales bacterium]MDD4739670.1 hypothetical protein [Bacteroidales bacterium]